jgi:hypothetical protein
MVMSDELNLDKSEDYEDAEFVDDDIQVCPHCGYSDAPMRYWAGETTISGAQAQISTECPKCLASWINIYFLAGYNCLLGPEKEEVAKDDNTRNEAQI